MSDSFKKMFAKYPGFNTTVHRSLFYGKKSGILLENLTKPASSTSNLKTCIPQDRRCILVHLGSSLHPMRPVSSNRLLKRYTHGMLGCSKKSSVSAVSSWTFLKENGLFATFCESIIFLQFNKVNKNVNEQMLVRERKLGKVFNNTAILGENLR